MEIKMTIYTPVQLGRAARHLRQDRGKTQEMLAAELGVNQRWISELETGKEVVALTRTLQIFDYLGATIKIEWDDDLREQMFTEFLRENFPKYEPAFMSRAPQPETRIVDEDEKDDSVPRHGPGFGASLGLEYDPPLSA